MCLAQKTLQILGIFMTLTEVTYTDATYRYPDASLRIMKYGNIVYFNQVGDM